MPWKLGRAKAKKSCVNVDHHKSSDECVKRRHDGHHLSFSFHVTGNCCWKKRFYWTEEEVNPLPRELEPARKTGAIPCEKNCVYESTLPHHGVPGTTFRTSETIIPFNQPHKQPRYLIYVHLENKNVQVWDLSYERSLIRNSPFLYFFHVQKFVKVSYCVNELQLFLIWKDLLDTTRLSKITKREVICK